MIKFIAVSLSVLFFSVILKDRLKPFALLLSVSGCVLLVFTVGAEIKNVISLLSSISEIGGEISAYISLMLRVLLIIFITQLVSEICRDNGENAIATATETVAKIVVITLIIPLFESVIKIVTGLTK